MKTALEEACEDVRHYYNLWKAAERRAERAEEVRAAAAAVAGMVPRIRLNKYDDAWARLDRALLALLADGGDAGGGTGGEG